MRFYLMYFLFYLSMILSLAKGMSGILYAFTDVKATSLELIYAQGIQAF